jgi:CheY-like chemotaxis protein
MSQTLVMRLVQAEVPNMSLVEILIVDDFEPWRQFVAATLQKVPGLRVIGVASDGSEAVQKAEELQPDRCTGIPNTFCE